MKSKLFWLTSGSDVFDSCRMVVNKACPGILSFGCKTIECTCEPLIGIVSFIKGSWPLQVPIATTTRSARNSVPSSSTTPPMSLSFSWINFETPRPILISTRPVLLASSSSLRVKNSGWSWAVVRFVPICSIERAGLVQSSESFEALPFGSNTTE